MITKLIDWKSTKINEEIEETSIKYDFDRTNLYKYLKDAFYALRDLSAEEAAMILEEKLNEDYNITKK